MTRPKWTQTYDELGLTAFGMVVRGTALAIVTVAAMLLVGMLP
jgi:hypothetical protein